MTLRARRYRTFSQVWAFHPMDLIAVGPVDREPIGRRWLTVAVDTRPGQVAAHLRRA
jgi:hypothetical protein